jgi:tRNA-splicing ligase RtcB (3'-phosphate/5'-hydroxy nucleic acid ligase)
MRMSRTKAKQMVDGGKLRMELEAMGVSVQAGSMQGLAEEAPAAYKDVNDVVGAWCRQASQEKLQGWCRWGW